MVTPAAPGRVRSLLRVGLPVVVAATLVALAIVNIAVVKTWEGQVEDGVLWRQEGANVVAIEVAADHAGARAGIEPRDVLLAIDGREVTSVSQVTALMAAAVDGEGHTYLVQRSTADLPIGLTLEISPHVQHPLYYSLALVGILAVIVGASVRLRRPHDQATLHFFWLTAAFFGVLAFTAAGRYDRLDYIFDWADLVARLLLPPLFLHFALVFPERPNAWVRTTTGKVGIVLIYLPAALIGLTRAAAVRGIVDGPAATSVLTAVEYAAYIYLALCLLAGLTLMTLALGRLRSVTAQRQLRWIVWGSAVGVLPFVALYVVPLVAGFRVPYTEYTAILLGCVPLSFASALVRYRLMDIELIIRKAMVAAAVVILLALIYSGTLILVGFVLPDDSADRGSFWALFATLIVALVAPALRTSIQNALDRLYYRDRYDYRRALVSFARELNSDLDLQRLAQRLVEHVRETLGVDRMVLFLTSGAADVPRFKAFKADGFDTPFDRVIEPSSTLGSRLALGDTVVLSDVTARRIPPHEAAAWREVGLAGFVPCVSNESTIAVLAFGHRPHGEPLNSEDITLLNGVAAQAATALTNARLYDELSAKADEIERLRQFSDSVVESLSDGLVVVDLYDRVLRWNRRMEVLVEVSRDRALGRDLGDLFSRPFVESLQAARRDTPDGAAMYRVPLDIGTGEGRRQLLVNTAIAPFQTAEGVQAGWIIVVEDVTDRANLEEQLRLSEKMASIGLLAAGVAHEVNTPLTGISSFTQMLLDRSDPADPDTQLLSKIEQQTFRAAKIVNSLLNLSRPSGGETRVIELNTTIGDVLSLVEHQFRAQHVQVRRHLDGPPVFVRGVEYKLQQVFLNLFLNARDAMPKGGELTVTSAISGDEALVEVADTGIGIPPEHLARIYDPFFTTKPEGRGTGLGLSVTFGIVQEHGGTLTCESDPHEGTRFRLVLPLEAPAAPVEPDARGVTHA